MVFSLTLTLLLGAADDLAATKIGGLTVSVPAAWKKTVADGTYKYEAPSEDAAFELSVFRVKPPRESNVCLEELLKAVGTKGWSRVSLGGAPAARKLDVDAGQAVDAGTPKQFVSHTYLGCDGDTKWLFTLTMSGAKRARFEPLAESIAQSIRYPK